MVPEVAKQHEEFVRAIAFGVLASDRARFWLEENTRKLVGRFYEDFPKPGLVLLTDKGSQIFELKIERVIEKLLSDEK